MSDIHIPVNGHNLTNICSTWSVSPASFFPQRRFGFKNWVRSQWNPFEDVLLGLSVLPDLGTKPDHEAGIPFVLVLNDAVVKGLQRVSIGKDLEAVIIERTIHLPEDLRIIARNKEEWRELLAKVHKSLEAKFHSHLEKLPVSFINESLPTVELGDLERKVDHAHPKDSVQRVQQDQRANKLGGALLGLQIGAAKRYGPEASSVLKAWKELCDAIKARQQGARSLKVEEALRQRCDAALEACLHGLERFVPADEAERQALEAIGYGFLTPEILDREGDYGTLRQLLMDRLQQRDPDALPLAHRLRMVARTGSEQSLNALERTLMGTIRKPDEILANIRAVGLDQGEAGFSSRGDALEGSDRLLMNEILNAFIQRTDLSHPEQMQEQRRQVVTEIGRTLGRTFPDWPASPERKELLEILEATTAPIPKIEIRTMRNPVLQALALLILRGQDVARFRDALEDADVDDPVIPFGLWGAAFGLANLPKTLTADVLEQPGYSITKDLMEPVEAMAGAIAYADHGTAEDPRPSVFAEPLPAEGSARPAPEEPETSGSAIATSEQKAAEQPEEARAEVPQTKKSPKAKSTRSKTKKSKEEPPTKLPEEGPVEVEFSVKREPAKKSSSKKPRAKGAAEKPKKAGGPEIPFPDKQPDN